MSLVLFDLDKFKDLNDTHGHRAGDEVLRLVAQTIQRESRTYDLAARYGGEEFALILPSSDSRRAMETAERIRSAIGAIDTIDTPVPVTCSAGVATFPLHAVDAETLVKTADRALYHSKNTGRDRTSLASRTLVDQGEAWVSDQAPPAETTVVEGPPPSGAGPSDRPF